MSIKDMPLLLTVGPYDLSPIVGRITIANEAVEDALAHGQIFVLMPVREVEYMAVHRPAKIISMQLRVMSAQRATNDEPVPLAADPKLMDREINSYSLRELLVLWWKERKETD